MSDFRSNGEPTLLSLHPALGLYLTRSKVLNIRFHLALHPSPSFFWVPRLAPLLYFCRHYYLCP